MTASSLTVFTRLRAAEPQPLFAVLLYTLFQHLHRYLLAVPLLGFESEAYLRLLLHPRDDSVRHTGSLHLLTVKER
jgi:hypothetical protein